MLVRFTDSLKLTNMNAFKKNPIKGFYAVTYLYVASKYDDTREYKCNGRVKNGVKNCCSAFAEVCRANRQARLIGIRN